MVTPALVPASAKVIKDLKQESGKKLNEVKTRKTFFTLFFRN
jgi:hypothetical protein